MKIDDMELKKMETTYRAFLCELKNMNMTAAEIKKDRALYNRAGELTCAFLRKIALCTSHNTRLIAASSSDDPDMYLNDVCMHLLNKLDYILEREISIPLIMTMVTNEVNSLYKKECKVYSRQMSPEGETTSFVNFIDEIAWSLIADDFDLEDMLVRTEKKKEARSEALYALSFTNCLSRFEAVALLSTKVLTGCDNKCLKTKKLAELLDKHGLMALSESVFRYAAYTFDLDPEVYFLTFCNNDLPPYSDLKDLCDKISKASNYGARKLRKKLLNIGK